MVIHLPSAHCRRRRKEAPNISASGLTRRCGGARCRGSLMVELLVAMAMLVGILMPVAYSIASEKRLARACYQRAVAMEIVDGELEVLAAGEWRAFTPGTHEYVARAQAATNLPPGKLLLTIQPGKVRLEWRPEVKQHGGPVTREADVQ
jgi:hypothetical protein